MRHVFLLAVVTATAVAAVEIRDANAVVYCVEGVYRAGCVARPIAGAAVVGGPVVSTRGVARRTARRTTRRVDRRSDMMLKHDIALIGHLQNGLGYYRFAYNGADKAYVGVMAQEVQMVVPQAVRRDSDGYLRVNYERLGLQFQTYEHWIASGAHIPRGVPAQH